MAATPMQPQCRTSDDAKCSTQQVWETVPTTQLPSMRFRPRRRLGSRLPSMSSRDLFCKFVPRRLINEMVTATNQYATGPKFGNYRSVWERTTTNELTAWLGLKIFMGVVQQGDTDGYWSEKTLVPFVSNAMTRDRFQLIQYRLHITAEVVLGQDNIWSKLLPLRDSVLQGCKTSFVPFEHITVDEQMCAFKGVHQAKQYLPSKPVRFGFKLFVSACADTAFILNFDIYPGALNATATGKSYKPEDIVMRLVDQWLGVGRVVVTDSYYTSLSLAKRLWENKTRFCGTVRKGRVGLPSQMNSPKLARGHSVSFQQSPFVATAWGDRSTVRLLSSGRAATNNGKVRRWCKGGTLYEYDAPPPLILYSRYMRGVDRADQYLEYFRPKGKSQRWWMVLALHLINIAVHNAYVLYRNNSNNLPISNRDFRLSLATELVDGYRGHKIVGRPKKRKRAAKESSQHYPCKRWSRQCCRNCGSKTREARSGCVTIYGCEQCNIPLCPVPCFKEYHQRCG